MTPDEVRELLFTERTARDRQAAVGPSEICGCRRKVWHRLNGTQITNPGTLRQASSMGTAWHSWIEERLAGNERFLLETTVERDGIRGHVDCFDTETGEVIDWKTIRMSGVPYFPKRQQRMQVQIYGWLMSLQHEVRSVCLVGFVKDATERELVVHQEPYDEGMAREGLAWLEEVRGMADPPGPEMPLNLCRDYCGYYDPAGVVGCPGGARRR